MPDFSQKHGQASEAERDSATPRVTNIRHRRRWWMPIAAIGIGFLPFLVTELLLRWAAPSQADALDLDPYVDLHQLRPLFEKDPTTDRWKIPEQRWNFFRPDSFAEQKPSTLRRIFVLGGSTVQGRPYAVETAFSTWLRLHLEADYPDLQFEVVNCGGVSYASYRVSKILEEVLQHQPDAIVLYTGHNEFLEDREYADVRDTSDLGAWMSRALSRVRTVTWIQQQLRSSPPSVDTMSQEVDARLDHPGGLDRYKRDAQWRHSVEQHFAASLSRMVRQVKRADVPLWLCVPTSDVVATPPFKTELDECLTKVEHVTWRENWAVAIDDQRDSGERIDACRDALRIDPEDAAAHYLLGRLLYDQGDSEQAKEHLIAARDFDVCPLRATSPIVDAVIRIGEAESVPLIMTPELSDGRDGTGARRPDGVPDREFFVDHLHPTIRGHQQIAAAIAESMHGSSLLKRSDLTEEETKTRYEQLAQDHLQTLGEDYYARGKQRLEGLKLWASGRAGQSSLDTFE